MLHTASRDVVDSSVRQRDRALWEMLERASDLVVPGHPAELHIRHALAAAESHWRANHVPSQDATEAELGRLREA